MGHCRKLFRLFKGVLSSRTIQHEHHLIRCIRKYFFHHLLDFLQLVHQSHLIVQTTCRINQHHISTIGLGTLQGIESHRGRVTTHLLLHHRHTYALTPDAQLLHGSGTEGVSSTQINLLASLLKLPSQLSDGRGLTHSIHAHYQDDVGFMITGQVPVIVIIRIILCQQGCYLITQDGIQFTGGHIFIASHALFDTLDNLQRGFYTHIRGNQYFLQVVQHIVIHLRFASYSTSQLIEHTGLGFLQTFIQCFLFFLIKKTENTHIAIYYECKVTKK